MATAFAPGNTGRYHQSRQKRRETPPEGVEPKRDVVVEQASEVSRVLRGRLILGLVLGFTLGLVVGIVVTTIVH